MRCERCQASAANVITAVDGDTGAVLETRVVCDACLAVPPAPRPVRAAEIRAVLAAESSGRAAPPWLFPEMAADLRRRAAHFGEPLPSDAQAFVDRHPSRG